MPTTEMIWGNSLKNYATSASNCSNEKLSICDILSASAEMDTESLPKL